ncbi:antitoxin Xre/MbcA/ParS toxin-binding domain-containing protein [Xanthobacter autotrophicus DSM 431]|uniref:type II RES/Xre toxin-antitoxin system antitoxin n=1 Tax=Xanthobacter nonsaccharivorans TaxID=3119912 RepID=UPI00372A3CBC
MDPVGMGAEAPEEVVRVAELLGGEQVLHRQVVTPLDAHWTLRAGLPSEALSHVMGNLSVVNRETFLDMGVGIHERTMQRKQRMQAMLDPEQSRRLWTFADILARATDVLGSQEEAERWLLRPALALEQNRPIDLISTPAGEALVQDLLGRMEYGVYT